MPNQERKRGRPPGAKTKSETPGRKRAREYFDLRFDGELGSSAAASIAADKFDVEHYQIFKDVKRHEPFIANEVSAEAEKIRQENEAMRAAMDMGPHELKGLAGVYHMLIESVKGNTQ